MTTDSTRSAAVDRSYHWLPTGQTTPRGVKLQLINRPAGVATYGNYDPKDTFWTHYALMPTFEKCSVEQRVLDTMRQNTEEIYDPVRGHRIR